MKRPTYKSIQEAAKKSKRAAKKSSLQKYLYLLQLSPDEVKNISLKFLCSDGCAICVRYDGTKRCPLDVNCNGDCIDEWNDMKNAWEGHRNYSKEFSTYPDDYYYNKFIAYATKVYLKLLEL